MGAQTLTEIYRTGERDGTFRASAVINYFGPASALVAAVSALSSTPTRACIQELEQHLAGLGVVEYCYYRHNVLKVKRYQGGGSQKRYRFVHQRESVSFAAKVA